MPLEWEELVTQLDTHMPREAWAQTLVGIGVLILTALFVQWVVARVVLLLAHRVLVLSGRKDWDQALQRRRAYQNLWYAVPFAVVSLGIGLVPHVEKAVTIVGRLAHAGAWICVFIAFSGVLSAWQDTYSATTRAQTRSIKGYIQIGKLILMAVCTVTTVPTYKLFSESYRNYRHMFESGGRRIKRTLRIDASTVRFLTDDEAQRLMRFRLLHDYLQAKTQDIAQTNQTMGELASVPANRRRLTNIGTFRAYGLAFLKQNKEVRQDMAMMVRMMEPTADGIPVEVYCFTAVTAWVEYERIQGDIFDHLLAILPELGLRLYQQPSGADIGAMGTHLREGAIQAALAAERDRQVLAPPMDGMAAEHGMSDGKMPR